MSVPLFLFPSLPPTYRHLVPPLATVAPGLTDDEMSSLPFLLLCRLSGASLAFLCFQDNDVYDLPTRRLPIPAYRLYASLSILLNLIVPSPYLVICSDY